jgi:hypothetical protein
MFQLEDLLLDERRQRGGQKRFSPFIKGLARGQNRPRSILNGVLHQRNYKATRLSPINDTSLPPYFFPGY